jgi:hypothetical protein
VYHLLARGNAFVVPIDKIGESKPIMARRKPASGLPPQKERAPARALFRIEGPQ